MDGINTVTISVGEYQAMAIAQANFDTLVDFILKRATWSNYSQGLSFRDEDINTALAVMAPGFYSNRVFEVRRKLQDEEDE